MAPEDFLFVRNRHQSTQIFYYSPTRLLGARPSERPWAKAASAEAEAAADPADEDKAKVAKKKKKAAAAAAEPDVNSMLSR